MSHEWSVNLAGPFSKSAPYASLPEINQHTSGHVLQPAKYGHAGRWRLPYMRRPGASSGV